MANLHVDRGIDHDRTWDSVIYDSPCLGYVDCAHQRTQLSRRTVLTYYRPFGQADVATARRALARASWQQLASTAVADLSVAHPELPSQISRIDVMAWGHAMPRPRPGFLGSKPFQATPTMLAPGIAWAHVDQPGLALFEEANLRGVRAAEQIAQAVGVDLGESWL